jgi:hypothetical protein
MKLLGRALAAGWLLLILTAGLAFAFPKPVSRMLRSFAPHFQLVPVFLLMGTVVYVLCRIYRLGMERPHHLK